MFVRYVTYCQNAMAVLHMARPNLGSIRGFLPGRVPQELRRVVEDAARGCGRTARRQQWALWFARVCLAPHWSILTTSMDPFPRQKRARRQEGCATTSQPNNTQCARRITWTRYRRSLDFALCDICNTVWYHFVSWALYFSGVNVSSCAYLLITNNIIEREIIIIFDRREKINNTG